MSGNSRSYWRLRCLLAELLTDTEAMRAAGRHGGLPLSAYLVALLIVPMLAAGVFGYREIQGHRDRAARSAELADLVGLRVASSTLRAPLQVERLSNIGLARLGSFGLPVEPVVEATGLDFEGIVVVNNTRLELGRARIDQAIQSDIVPNSVRIEFEASNLELDRIRTRVASGDYPSADDVAAAFARVEAVLDQLADLSDAAAEQVGPPSVREANLVDDLDALSVIATTAAGEIQALTDALLFSQQHDFADNLRASTRHADALAGATSVNVAEVDVLLEQYERLPEFDPEVLASLSEIPFDLGGVRELAGVMIERVDYMDVVADFVFAESERGVDLLAERSVAAENDNRMVLITVLFVAVATVVVALVVARSIARPLITLRGQAERISSGELTAEPLDLEGPSDVREVTASVNDMAATLARVDEHMEALATSDLEQGLELTGLPGKVGASMRDSMERVAALTRRLRASEVRLAEEARIDDLTGLPNRFAVLEYLSLLLDQASQGQVEFDDIGVMFVDVDGFKSVNDTHGHAVGDVVLREIGRRLGASIRPVDFVARLGGDEFLVVVTDAVTDDALHAFGERLIAAIEQPYEVGDQLFAVSASVGVTVVVNGDDSLTAIDRADAAVYQAKRRGRRRVEMFDEELQASIEHDAELELALRRAIELEELCIHFQPVARLDTGVVSGAEVLVRWERPGVGLLPPNDFIPIAERSGLIFDLERWVLHAACRQLADWDRRGVGHDLRLAVNISGRHLIEGDLIANLDQAAAATGADPSRISIELTESQLLDDVDRAIQVLSALRQRGVRIAIDDFGTGYSSMTYLEKLPLDVVKIDRSFVGNAASSDFGNTVIASVVTLGRALSIDVLAEGIETIEQLQLVAAAGCQFGQGYLLSRPTPIDEAEQVLLSDTPILDHICRSADGRAAAHSWSGGHPRQ